jgi:sialic acid synthase SpsE
MKIKINANRFVGKNEYPYIIAEVGSNHNGDMDLAKKLIDAAKKSGADCVKFQSWSKDTIFSKIKYEENVFLSDDYRNRDDYSLEKIVEEYSISEEQLIEMRDYSQKIGIDFTSTPFSKREVDFMVQNLNVDFIKIASMDLNNYQFLDYVARKGKPIILSTGLSTLAEIDKAVSVIEEAGNDQLIILHCVAIYPPKDKQVNLNNIDSLSNLYQYPIGFSDHSIGTSIPLAAVAKGASVIEKHFTLDKDMEGWDHKVSANPDEMATITKDSKHIFNALGSKRITRIEPKDRVSEFRRSIVAARDIEIGEIFTDEMLDYKRPGGGFDPEYKGFILGRTAQRNIPYDHLITADDV